MWSTKRQQTWVWLFWSTDPIKQNKSIFNVSLILLAENQNYVLDYKWYKWAAYLSALDKSGIRKRTFFMLNLYLFITAYILWIIPVQLNYLGCFSYHSFSPVLGEIFVPFSVSIFVMIWYPMTLKIFFSCEKSEICRDCGPRPSIPIVKDSKQLSQ